ncbi:undecaprenyl-phosphate glucose phosphotransferase [Amphritea sp. HPY]|uniref:undecaprenyl-phosphate glucose phosphotransferase n=1 Tax=Amphritea sp. HPY TaxID=3421652 RepID=UPI003D7E6DBD
MEDIESIASIGRPLLQRRNSLTNVLQSLIDAFVVLTIFALLMLNMVGAISYDHVLFALIMLGAMAGVYDYFGIYRRNSNPFKKSFDLIKAWLISLMIALTLVYLLQVLHHISREFLVSFAVAGFFGQFFAHLLLRAIHIARTGKAKVNAIIIGSDSFANYLRKRINTNPWVRDHVIGLLSLSESKTPEGCIGNIANLLNVMHQHEVRTVYLALPFEDAGQIKSIYEKLQDLNVDVHWVPNIHALKLINQSVKELAGFPVITLSETPLIGTHQLKKSVVDKVLATIALIAFSPIMLGTALAIKFTSAGPVFFKQPRTGWDGREFMIWKFRSMYVHQIEADKLQQATKEDPRITPVGRFIRRTSIDELPQLINVLIGNMSMVGPRPHAVQHNKEYSEQISAYLCRHRIKPGITGLAQVRGLRGETEELELMSKRVESDMEYINNWSITLDIIILFKTAFTLFGSRAY